MWWEDWLGLGGDGGRGWELVRLWDVWERGGSRGVEILLLLLLLLVEDCLDLEKDFVSILA